MPKTSQNPSRMCIWGTGGVWKNTSPNEMFGFFLCKQKSSKENYKSIPCRQTCGLQPGLSGTQLSNVHKNQVTHLNNNRIKYVRLNVINDGSLQFSD